MSANQFRSLVLIGLLSAGACSGPDYEASRQLSVPKGAILISLPSAPRMPTGSLKGFWLAQGEQDAPVLRLVIADEKHYRDDPFDTVLEIRCDPWARGLVIGAGAISIQVEPPHPWPTGHMLKFEAGDINLTQPVHPRYFGSLKFVVPGAFYPAEDFEIRKLASVKTLIVGWGARSATLPAPPQEILTDFTDRCADAFEFGKTPDL